MSKPPYPTTGLHPAQVRALRDHKGLSQVEFARVFGTAAHVVDHWEIDGLSTGPTAVAVHAVASAWSFQFPPVEGIGKPCTICASDGIHEVFELPVCRSCYLTPRDSMVQLGYRMSLVDDVENDADLEVKAPAESTLKLPPSLFGPEDWKTAVKKLRTDEHQTGYSDFDDLVYIAYIEDATQARLNNPSIRALIADLVPFGELELIGDAARLHLFRRSERPENELVLRLGLLMSLLCEHGK